ncbi:MAG: TIGR03364 family FAD-dependent oxidoreductase [Dermatophilus congolensis]|nr:TIGR03364 family FAD-dependent oxidoreductase [Dermatophilus congolensis]
MNSTDVIIVGAGIVGLAHAFEAHRRRLSVRVVERDTEAVGASVRNFGHACLTAQAPEHAERLVASRAGWLDAAAAAGFWAQEAGAVFIARSATEMHLVEAFAATRPEASELQTPEQVRERLGGGDPRIVGGVFLPLDLRVDPRTTAQTLAAYLAEQGVAFEWGTRVGSIRPADSGGLDKPAVVHTSRGAFSAERVIVCVGHDLSYLFPDLADSRQVERCRLAMALVEAPSGFTTDTAVLSATSMLRYAGFAALPEAEAVRREIEADAPYLLEIGTNLMMTRRPDGTVIVGDSHHYGTAAPPFVDETVSEALLGEAAALLGVPALRVLQRWQGVYASSPQQDILRHQAAPGVESVTVTTGLGMTLAFGLAAETFNA